MTNVNDIFVDTFFDIFGQTEADDVTPPDTNPLEGTPSGQQILDIVMAPTTRVTRRCEICNSDGSVYLGSPSIIGGNVTVDASRDERRMFDLELRMVPELRIGDGALWYDKTVKLYRGVQSRTDTFEWPIGTFRIDKMGEAHHPGTVKLAGRDRTKLLLQSKTRRTATLTAGQDVASIIRFIAALAGVVDLILPWNDANPSPVLDQTFAFERGTQHWKIIKDICTAYALEVFFNARGFLVVRPYRDPVLTPSVLTFATGPSVGNLVTYDKSTNDSLLFNAVQVIGQSQGRDVIFAEATVTNANAPTHRDKIGDRLMDPIVSSFVTTQAQADTLALARLRIAALESYELAMTSIVVPWIEAGEVVTFLDPNPANLDDPKQFFLNDFTIPLALEAMPLNAKRVEVIV